MAQAAGAENTYIPGLKQNTSFSLSPPTPHPTHAHTHTSHVFSLKATEKVGLGEWRQVAYLNRAVLTGLTARP